MSEVEIINYRELGLSVDIYEDCDENDEAFGKWFYYATWEGEEAGSEYGFETEDEALKAGRELIDSWWESEGH